MSFNPFPSKNGVNTDVFIICYSSSDAELVVRHASPVCCPLNFSCCGFLRVAHRHHVADGAGALAKPHIRKSEITYLRVLKLPLDVLDCLNIGLLRVS